MEMRMRSGARAAPVWGWRWFLRGCVVFYAHATGIQEENQIGRGGSEGLPKTLRTDSVRFGRLPYALAFFWSIGLSTRGACDCAPRG